MATLRDVTHIIIDRGVTHIVASEASGWVHTLCGTMQTGESQKPWPLKPRICRKCRERLKAAAASKPAGRENLDAAVR